MKLFFKNIEHKKNSLSSSELQVFNYLKDYSTKFLSQNIAEISASVYVSTATVSRTIKKLGYSNLTEFKFYLKLAITGEKTEQISKENFFDYVDYDQFVSINRANLDVAQVTRVTQYIEKAHHIEFIGLGPSYTVAVDGARRLMFAGKSASNRSDWDEIERVVNTIDNTNLVFLISCSGETPVMGKYAQTLYERQVNTVGIIGNLHSSLSKLVNESFEVQIPNLSYQNLDLSTRIPLLQIVEIIIDEYIYQYKM